jgi:hypothetical protein
MSTQSAITAIRAFVDKPSRGRGRTRVAGVPTMSPVTQPEGGPMTPQGFNGQGGKGQGGKGRDHGGRSHTSNHGGAGRSNAGQVSRSWVTVDFRMQADHLDARSVHLVGEFNAWSSTATPMMHSESQFVVSLQLQTGRTYRYKFLVDGQRWENDWNADAYVSNEFGGDDSLLDLTNVAGTESADQHDSSTPSPTPAPAPADPDSPGRAIDDDEGEIPEPNEPA